MDFNEKGFLGTAVAEFSNAAEKEYANFFNACYRINEIAQDVKFEFQIHNQDGQEVMAACLFMRILNGFQAVIILARLGLVVDAKVVLRGILEALFILKLLCDEAKFVVEYVRTDQAQRLKWMNIAHQNTDPVFDSLRQYATPERMKTLKDELNTYGIKKLNIENVAKRAKLTTIYNTDYRLLSYEIHSTPRSLEHYTAADQDEIITGFPWGPSDNGLAYILFTAVRVLAIGVDSAAKLFKVDRRKQLAQVDEVLDRLASLLN